MWSKERDFFFKYPDSKTDTITVSSFLRPSPAWLELGSTEPRKVFQYPKASRAEIYLISFYCDVFHSKLLVLSLLNHQLFTAAWAEPIVFGNAISGPGATSNLNWTRASRENRATGRHSTTSRIFSYRQSKKWKARPSNVSRRDRPAENPVEGAKSGKPGKTRKAKRSSEQASKRPSRAGQDQGKGPISPKSRQRV